MNNSMLDFKPFRQCGYTGNRHDDRPDSLTKEQVGILSFVAGLMFAITISLLLGGA